MLLIPYTSRLSYCFFVVFVLLLLVVCYDLLILVLSLLLSMDCIGLFFVEPRVLFEI